MKDYSFDKHQLCRANQTSQNGYDTNKARAANIGTNSQRTHNRTNSPKLTHQYSDSRKSSPQYVSETRRTVGGWFGKRSLKK